MTKEIIEEMNRRCTDVGNLIIEKRKKSVGRGLVTTSESKIIGIIED